MATLSKRILSVKRDHMEKQTLSKSICLAILPFENFTPQNELAYFARGFVEDLLTDLSGFIRS